MHNERNSIMDWGEVAQHGLWGAVIGGGVALVLGVIKYVSGRGASDSSAENAAADNE